MSNYKDSMDDEPQRGVGGSKGFKTYLQKARLAYSLLPEQKVNMQNNAKSSANRLMRNRILANYGLNIDQPPRTALEKYLR